MKSHIVIQGNAFYEVDEACVEDQKRKKEQIQTETDVQKKTRRQKERKNFL